MFIAAHGLAHFVTTDVEALVLLAISGTREATATEAAECINRLTMSGAKAMHAANAEFKLRYGKAHSFSTGNGACQIMGE